jgi:NAD(P)H-binding
VILVTGATGNIGSALLRQLHMCGTAPLRGLTRDAARASFPDGVEAVEGDFAQTASLKPALDGVRSLFLVSRMGADADVLAAARQAGVEHVVLVSSCGRRASDYPPSGHRGGGPSVTDRAGPPWADICTDRSGTDHSPPAGRGHRGSSGATSVLRRDQPGGGSPADGCLRGRPDRGLGARPDGRGRQPRTPSIPGSETVFTELRPVAGLGGRDTRRLRSCEKADPPRQTGDDSRHHR